MTELTEKERERERGVRVRERQTDFKLFYFFR